MARSSRNTPTASGATGTAAASTPTPRLICTSTAAGATSNQQVQGHLPTTSLCSPVIAATPAIPDSLHTTGVAAALVIAAWHEAVAAALAEPVLLHSSPQDSARTYSVLAHADAPVSTPNTANTQQSPAEATTVAAAKSASTAVPTTPAPPATTPAASQNQELSPKQQAALLARQRAQQLLPGVKSGTISSFLAPRSGSASPVYSSGSQGTSISAAGSLPQPQSYPAMPAAPYAGQAQPYPAMLAAPYAGMPAAASPAPMPMPPQQGAGGMHPPIITTKPRGTLDPYLLQQLMAMVQQQPHMALPFAYEVAAVCGLSGKQQQELLHMTQQLLTTMKWQQKNMQALQQAKQRLAAQEQQIRRMQWQQRQLASRAGQHEAFAYPDVQAAFYQDPNGPLVEGYQIETPQQRAALVALRERDRVYAQQQAAAQGGAHAYALAYQGTNQDGGVSTVYGVDQTHPQTQPPALFVAQAGSLAPHEEQDEDADQDKDTDSSADSKTKAQDASALGATSDSGAASANTADSKDVASVQSAAPDAAAKAQDKDSATAALDDDAYSGRKNVDNQVESLYEKKRLIEKQLRAGKSGVGKPVQMRSVLLERIAKQEELRRLDYQQHFWDYYNERLIKLADYKAFLLLTRQKLHQEAVKKYQQQNADPVAQQATKMDSDEALEKLTAIKHVSPELRAQQRQAAAAAAAAAAVSAATPASVSSDTTSTTSTNGSTDSSADATAAILTQQTTTGFAPDDPRHLGAKMMSSISLTKQDASVDSEVVFGKDGAASTPPVAVSPVGSPDLTVVPHTVVSPAALTTTSSVQPTVLTTTGQEGTVATTTVSPLPPLAPASSVATALPTAQDAGGALGPSANAQKSIASMVSALREDDDDMFGAAPAPAAGTGAGTSTSIGASADIGVRGSASGLEQAQGSSVLAHSMPSVAVGSLAPQAQDSHFTAPQSVVQKVDGSIDTTAEHERLKHSQDSLTQLQEAQKHAHSDEERAALQAQAQLAALSALDNLDESFKQVEKLRLENGSAMWYDQRKLMPTLIVHDLEMHEKPVKLHEPPVEKAPPRNVPARSSANASRIFKGTLPPTHDVARQRNIASLEQDVAIFRQWYEQTLARNTAVWQEVASYQQQGYDMAPLAASFRALIAFDRSKVEVPPTLQTQVEVVPLWADLAHGIQTGNSYSQPWPPQQATQFATVGAAVVPAGSNAAAFTVSGEGAISAQVQVAASTSAPAPVPVSVPAAAAPMAPAAPQQGMPAQGSQSQQGGMYAQTSQVPQHPQGMVAPAPASSPMQHTPQPAPDMGDDRDAAMPPAQMPSQGDDFADDEEYYGGGSGAPADAGVNFDSADYDEDDGEAFSGNVELDMSTAFGGEEEEPSGEGAAALQGPADSSTDDVNTELVPLPQPKKDSGWELLGPVAVDTKVKMKVMDFLPEVAKRDSWYQLILQAYPERDHNQIMLTNVERQIDPNDASHWRLIIKESEDFGSLTDMANALSHDKSNKYHTWDDVRQRFESVLGQPLRFDLVRIQELPEHAPLREAQRLAQLAAQQARQSLSQVQGLTQLLSQLHENIEQVGIELYRDADPEETEQH